MTIATESQRAQAIQSFVSLGGNPASLSMTPDEFLASEADCNALTQMLLHTQQLIAPRGLWGYGVCHKITDPGTGQSIGGLHYEPGHNGYFDTKAEALASLAVIERRRWAPNETYFVAEMGPESGFRTYWPN